MSVRDRIAAMLSLRSDPYAGMRQSERIEDRQGDPSPEAMAELPRSFDYAFKALPKMLMPGVIPMPPATPMSRALGSDDLDRGER